MSEPRHIVHLSALNPPLHPRIFYKWALSQREMGHRVSLIAPDPSPQPYEVSGIHIIPFQPFRRLSWRRFSLSFRLAQLARSLEADLYVIHAPELLALGVWLKRKTGAHLVYDVHEDYRANIRHGEHYPVWLRGLLARGVRRWEKGWLNQVDAVVYAEEVYDNILALPESRRFLLRNKFTARAVQGEARLPIPERPYLLLSGTLARERGLFETLGLWQRINAIRPLLLLIAGHSQQPPLLNELWQQVKASGLEDQFRLIGGDQFVPYTDMLSLIKHCWAGSLLYQAQANIVGKMPTKIYEHLAMGRPLIFTPEANWLQQNEHLQFGLPYQAGSEEALLTALDAWQAQPDPQVYDWQGEEAELTRLMNQLH